MTKKGEPVRSELGPQPTPSSLREIVAVAVELHQRGRLQDAEQVYRQVLEVAPNQVDAHHFLGLLCHQRGDPVEAVKRIRRALQLDPNYHQARLNLGNVLKEQGRLDEAAVEYRQILASDPRNVEAWNNLGTILKQQRKYDEAIAAFEQSLTLRPRYADAYHNLGNALKSANRLEEALTAYRQAIEIQPDHSEAHMSLGRALYRFGRIDEAAVAFSAWLEVDPQNPIPQHMLAACTGSNQPERASDAFIEQTFDRFADSFDDVLKRLEYRAPDLVAGALKAVLPPPAGNLDILDAGCGTGLCGPLLRPHAERLVGVDLSPRMLDKATGRACYDELVAAELTQHLQQSSACYDVIVSADTLVYFGNLVPVFEAAAAALRPDGHLVFTVEHAPDGMTDAGFQLNPHGRYSHTEQYIEQALADARLSIQQITRDCLRKEVQHPVPGLVVTARKDRSSAG